MKTFNKELATIITASPLISGVMANSTSTIITTPLTISLSTAGFFGLALPVVVSANEKTQGIITASGFNKVWIYNANTLDRISHPAGYPIYGRITESVGVYTLTYYYLLSGVETAYSIPGPISILFEAPYRAEIALLPTDYVAHRRKEAIDSVAQDPIRIQYIYGTANNKFTTSDGSGKLVTSFDFKAQTIPFISGAGIVATNVGDALDELKTTPFPAVVTADLTLADGFAYKAQHGTARLIPRYLSDSNILMSSTTDKTQAWVHLRPANSEIGFGSVSSLLFDASTAYLSSSKITLGADSQILTWHTALLWSSMNIVMASSIISGKNITINAGIYNSVALAGDTYIVKTANAGYIKKLILPDSASGFETVLQSASLAGDIILTLPAVTSKIIYSSSTVTGQYSYYASSGVGEIIGGIISESSFAQHTLGINANAQMRTTVTIGSYNIAADVVAMEIDSIGNLVNNSTGLILDVQNGLVSNTALNVQTGDIIVAGGRTGYGGAINPAVKVYINEGGLAFAEYTSLTTPTIALATGKYIEVTGAATTNVALHLNSINGITSSYALLIENGQSVFGNTVAVSAGALVEFYSLSQALLFPRLTTVQMNAVTAPTNGMIIYNTTDDMFYGYQGGAWSIVGAGSAILATPYPHNIQIDTTFYLQSETIKIKDTGSANIATITASPLSGARAINIPDVSGTIMLGSGTINKMPHFDTTNSIADSELYYSAAASSLGIGALSSFAVFQLASTAPAGGYVMLTTSVQPISIGGSIDAIRNAPDLNWTGGAGTAASWDLIFSAGTSSIGVGNTVTTVTSFRSLFTQASGITTNYYGVYLQAPGTAGGSITNTYAIVSEANAGNFGFGTLTPNTSAKLDIVSTTQGFLPPRMSSAQKTAISTPATGLVVYDTNLNKLCVWTGATWETVTSA